MEGRREAGGAVSPVGLVHSGSVDRCRGECTPGRTPGDEPELDSCTAAKEHGACADDGIQLASS